MVDQEYISTLVMYGKSSQARFYSLQARVDSLMNWISQNNGLDLIHVTVPGQVLTWNKTYSAQEELGAVLQAISIINGQPTIVRQFTPVMW